jgi:acyl-CoA synthetase (AMP-forming)/AMP-acid ligase II
MSRNHLPTGQRIRMTGAKYILKWFPANELSIPKDSIIYVHSLGRAVRYYGEKTALSIGGQGLTFNELDHRVERIAAGLSRRGLRTGDRLAVLLPNGPEYIELVYACSRLGVIMVPLSARYSSREIDRVLKDASPRALVRHSGSAPARANLEWQLALDKEPLDASNGRCPEVYYCPEAILAIIYTSGTTGEAKGVMLTHTNVLANVYCLNYWMRFRLGGACLHAASISQGADFPAMFAAAAFGTSQVTGPRFSPRAFCATVEKERITHTLLAPTMLSTLTKFSGAKQFDLSSLQVMAFGGSSIPVELYRRTRKLLPGIKLVHLYGTAETGFLTGLEAAEDIAGRLSCGQPCPGIDVQVADPSSGERVSAGQPGEIVARGTNVMLGYWNHPERTARAFRNHFFRTEDIGYQDGAGDLFIIDRLTDMIITGGEKVYCGEVEAVICEIPVVREAAVFGIPDLRLGELVAACVVLKAGVSLSKEELIRHCQQSFADYKVPRLVEFRKADLSKTAAGNVLKRPLRENLRSAGDRAVG